MCNKSHDTKSDTVRCPDCCCDSDSDEKCDKDCEDSDEKSDWQKSVEQRLDRLEKHRGYLGVPID